MCRVSQWSVLCNVHRVLYVCTYVFSTEQLVKLFSMMDPKSPERVAFVSRALKWSTGGSGKLGHPKLHQLLAVTLWKGISKPHTFQFAFRMSQRDSLVTWANFLSTFQFIQSKTTVSRATTSCALQMARAALRCWWSTRPLAAFAAKSTCSWLRPSYSKCTSHQSGLSTHQFKIQF